MLEFVIAVTIAVSNLSATEEAYRSALGYKVVERAIVSDQLAALWDAPAMAGRPYLLMQPESGADVYLRFVELEPVEGYAPIRTEGWNAVELLVLDTKKVAQRLEGSAFRITGAPKDLTGDGMVIAMQARGPSDEVLYLTSMAGERVNLYGQAETFVDRPFIVIVGARDHQALNDFYGARLGNEITPLSTYPITTISKAYGFPLDRTYPLNSARFVEKFSIEMDGYPEEAVSRPRRDGELPPGISIVSIGVRSLDAVDLEWRAAPREISSAPYNGRRAAIAVGPAGEWLELVEQPAAN